jgi:uncharacterized protein YabE (DUF348 family)
MEKTTPRRCSKIICTLVILLAAIVCTGYVSYEDAKGITGTDTHITAAVAQEMAGDQTKVTAGSQQYVADKISDVLSLSDIQKKASGVLRAKESVAADAEMLEKESSENVFALTTDLDLNSSPLGKNNMKTISVIIDIDGSRLAVTTKAGTVEGVLEDAGVETDSSDTVSPSLTASVSDGEVIKVTRAVTIHINVDGGSITAHVIPMKVSEALELQGIPVSSADEISPGLDTEVTDGMTVNIGRITSKTVTKYEKVAHKVKKIKDHDMLRGTKKVISKGSDGTANITYRIKFRYGKEVSRTAIKTEYVKKPVTEVVKVGTKKTKTIDGSTFAYTQKYTMVATAYCDGGYSASGPACGDGIIAVDPDVIPLGTKVYVEGYGYAIAADTGGYIIGNRIDLWMANNSICEQWGRQTVTLYIVD